MMSLSDTWERWERWEQKFLVPIYMFLLFLLFLPVCIYGEVGNRLYTPYHTQPHTTYQHLYGIHGNSENTGNIIEIIRLFLGHRGNIGRNIRSSWEQNLTARWDS